MEKWNQARYKELCLSLKAKILASNPNPNVELYHEVAEVSIREQQGLGDFIKKEFQVGAPIDMLADDIAFPENCDY